MSSQGEEFAVIPSTSIPNHIKWIQLKCYFVFYYFSCFSLCHYAYTDILVFEINMMQLVVSYFVVYFTSIWSLFPIEEFSVYKVAGQVLSFKW